MNQVEVLSRQNCVQPVTKLPGVVHKTRVHAVCEDTANMVPEVARTTCCLRQRHDLHRAEGAERSHALSLLFWSLPSRQATSLEAQRCHIERAGEQPQDMVGADPHAPVGWKGESLAEEQELGSLHRVL